MVRETTSQALKRINRVVTGDMAVFNAAIKKTIPVLKQDFTDFHALIALEALRRIVLKTPVGNPDVWKVKKPPKGYVGGRARGNWQLTIGKASKKVLEDRAKSSADTGDLITKGAQILQKLGFGQVVWIANNLDYILFLEDGHSGQAPKGMVSVTLQELRMIFP